MGDRVIQPSPFDEEIYGLRIGWAQGASALDHDRITTEATTDGYDLVFLRSDYPCRLHPMARLIDVRYDMTATPCGLPLPAIDGGVPLRIDEATALAASAFSHSRYLCDPQLNSRGGEVYRRWVHNAADRGELLLRPGGFLAMSHTETELRIALIAVDASCRGFGFGAAMVEEFLTLPDRRERRVKVECGNIRALAFYQAAGFSIASVEAVQHVWVK